MMKKIIPSLLLLFAMGTSSSQAQDFKPKSSAQLFHEIQSLNFLGNVLYIAAHPDDENTRLIAYLTHELHAKTSYLSLTRGDGGQNLIGTEIREELGLLRTQELLAARSIDGGSQYFTRANDFGFSKQPSETLEIWDKAAVLSDVVGRIRALRPDVIINRFDHRTPGSTHGHHTTSALLSMEAFELAANSNAYAAQLETLSPWQATRSFFNTSWWFYGSEEAFLKASKKGLVTLDVGVYYPSLGLSNNEIASQASSQHLCQGFGRLNSRGSENEYLEFLKGAAPENGNIFSGIDTSWNRIPEGAAIAKLLAPIEKDFNFKNPATHLQTLIKAYGLITQIEDSFWRDQKTEQITQLIKEVAGLHMSFETKQAYAAPGERIQSKMQILVRNSSDFSLKSYQTSLDPKPIEGNFTSPLALNNAKEIFVPLSLPQGADFSNPYWLNEPASLGMYTVKDTALIGQPESPAALSTSVTLSHGTTDLTFKIPLVYRYAKPDQGELWEEFRILPPISINLEKEVVLFPDQKPKKITLSINALTGQQEGTVFLETPEDWQVVPASYKFNLAEKGSSKRFSFQITPSSAAAEIEIKAVAQIKEAYYDQQMVTIAYKHIPTQRLLKTAQAKWVRLSIQKQEATIGYIMGAGDKIPESLEAIGYRVVLLKPENLNTEDLSKYKAVILGIRALNVSPEIALSKKVLLSYVKGGGVLISQYNTASRSGDNLIEIAPYPLKLSRDRVTKEEAAVRFLAKNHPVLNAPNKISPKDFDGWVQERGLYFPNQWDSAFTPILEMNDPGEAPKQGSLLVAAFGKGHFVYTGLSFFRELPAGVPGAYRLFSNIISLQPKIETDPIKN